MIEKESLHEIFTATIDCLQVGDTLLKYPEAMKINIRRLSTPEVQWVEVVGLSLVKAGEESNSVTHNVKNGGRTTTNLKSKGRSHLNRRQT